MKTKLEIDRLRRVLAHIDAVPELWDQNELAYITPCGTACCIAGHTVALEGHEFLFSNNGYAYTTIDGENLWYLAASLLGLTDDESDELFCEYNDREDVQRVAEAIAFRAGETL